MNPLTLNQIFDVAIVLVAVYATLSTVCSAVNEWIATLLALRGWYLFRGISQLVGSDDLAAKIMNHPLINAASTKPQARITEGIAQTNLARVNDVRRSGPPSYIDARNFSTSFWQVLGHLQHDAPLHPSAADTGGIRASGASGAATETSIEKLVGDLPESGLKLSLLGLSANAANDYDRLLRATDGWFNAQMDRVSGWYKRRTTLILCAIAFVLTSVAGIDTLHVIKVLTATDSATMQKLVAEAGIPAGSTATFDLTQFANVRGDCWNLGFWKSLWPGVLLTWLAVWLGGSFWFDVLCSLANVRSAGRKPKRGDQPPR